MMVYIYSEQPKKVVIACLPVGRKRRACTPKWRYACLHEAASAKAGHAGVAISEIASLCLQ